jgi:hypothetical protein
MFESQRDRVHASGEADSHGIEIDRRDLPNRVTTSSVFVTFDTGGEFTHLYLY